ncbi:type I glyceraldehyde-3-phosphate dehydrogenase [Patescibacteria group bacterium]
MRLAINGFGRIGRNSLKVALEKDDIEVVAINDLSDLENLAYLLRYDTVYGVYDKKVEVGDGKIIIDGKEIMVFSDPDPKNLPWGELDVDVVLECTGFFTNREKASAHIEAGAKEVVISAPAKDDSIKTVVMGVNEGEITADDHIVSNASCTTNCLAPMMKVLDDKFGVEKSLMSTIHSYTSTQSIVDGINKKDPRKGRAAAQNIIPSSTGAAIATTKTIPHLEGNFDGMAFRVPILVGSVSDLTVVLREDVTVEDIVGALREASEGALKGILRVTDDPLVSHDIIGDPCSCIVQADLTKVVGGNLAKVVGWYDNERGYSERLVEMSQFVARK